MLCRFVFFKEKTIHLRFSDMLRRDSRLSRDFLKVGMPIVAHEMIWSTGTTAGSSITGQMSTVIVTGYNVANVLYQLLSCVMNGVLHACSVTIGKDHRGGSREGEDPAGGLQLGSHRPGGGNDSGNCDSPRGRTFCGDLQSDPRRGGICPLVLW